MTLLDLVRLQRRRGEVLAKMSVVSDAPASVVGGGGMHVKGESKPPPFTRSLYWHWREQFQVEWPDIPDNPDQAAIDWCYARAEKLVEQAEADLDRYTGRLRSRPEDEVWKPLGEKSNLWGHSGQGTARAIRMEANRGSSLIRLAVRFGASVSHIKEVLRAR